MKSLMEYINESNTIELVSDGKERGFDYVDLGLPSGTMWATCNVGADKPEDEGLLFQFGRVDGYKYRDSNNQFITNSQRTTSGKVYKKNDILDLGDDAAHVNMGGKWRMPTGSYSSSTDKFDGDWGELLNNTTHEVVTINGVQGILFTSKINEHQLFIPFMQGCWYMWNNGEWQDWSRSYASMWSSQVNNYDAHYAYRLYSNSRGKVYIDGNHSRAYALAVRGVFRK